MFPGVQRRTTECLATLFVIAVLMMSVGATNVDDSMTYCMRMESNCRLKTQWNTLDGYRNVKLNISCFCESDEPEDVWVYLDKLSTKKCSYLPTDDQMKVNQSTIHITGCLIQKQVFPKSILELARRTDHLEIVINNCPSVRLGSITKAQTHVPLITASFRDSKLSGLPRGFLGHTDKLNVQFERCELPVVESRAIFGFDESADVQLDFVDTNIATVKMVAFDLPPSGRLSIKGGSVSAWEKRGYEGGSEINLEGVRFGRLLGGAFNLHGIRSFHMTKCTVAELLAEMVTDQKQGSTRSPLDVSTRDAKIEHNTFITANGDAFVNLCRFPSLLWQNNTFLNITEPPLRLQDENCETKRNWQDVVVVTGLSCTNCEDFTTVNEQSCAFYRSGYCTSCEDSNDECNEPLLHYLIQQKCLYSHPQVVSSLTEVCKFDPKAPKSAPRSLGGSGRLISVPSLILTTLAILYKLKQLE